MKPDEVQEREPFSGQSPGPWRWQKQIRRLAANCALPSTGGTHQAAPAPSHARHSAGITENGVFTALCWEAPAVAVLWQVFVAQILGVPIGVIDCVLLGAAVWVIYQGDHLLDARRADPARPMPARHRFARRHFRGLLTAVIGISSLGLLLAFLQLPRSLLLPGGLIGAGCGAYLLLVQWPPVRAFTRLTKEGLSSSLFAGGVFLAPLSRFPGTWSSSLFLALGLFAALCWFNMLEIGLSERSLDKIQDNLSAVRSSPHLPLLLPALEVLTAALAFVGMSLSADLPPLFLALGLSALLLLVLHVFHRYCPAIPVRILADLTLLTPLFWLLKP